MEKDGFAPEGFSPSGAGRAAPPPSSEGGERKGKQAADRLKILTFLLRSYFIYLNENPHFPTQVITSNPVMPNASEESQDGHWALH